MRTRTWSGAILTVLSACLLFASPMAMADKAAGAAKLEGAWVAKVVAPAEYVGGQWSYVLIPDPSGRRAYGSGSVDVGFNVEGFFGPTDSTSPILINVSMTGPDTALSRAIWYGRRKVDGVLTAEIAFIGEVVSEIKFVEPGRNEVKHDFAFYFPGQDSDGDGFPDQDTPIKVTIYTVDTRLPAP